MIVYNMRYRGPLEYDKFVLNILQFHNEIHAIAKKEIETPEFKNLAETQLKITNQYNKIVGKEDLNNPYNSIIGYSEDLYLNMLDMKEC